MDSDLAILCQSCGFCCDGSLFGRVPLRADEVASARRNRLAVLDSGRAFEQPCTALSVSEGPSGRRQACSIYDERPAACRSFACRLYARHQREGGPLEARLTSVRRVRQLIARLQASGLSPADFDAEPGGASSPDQAAVDAHAELMRLLEDDFARA